MITAIGLGNKDLVELLIERGANCSISVDITDRLNLIEIKRILQKWQKADIDALVIKSQFCFATKLAFLTRGESVFNALSRILHRMLGE